MSTYQMLASISAEPGEVYLRWWQTRQIGRGRQIAPGQIAGVQYLALPTALLAGEEAGEEAIAGAPWWWLEDVDPLDHAAGLDWWCLACRADGELALLARAG